MALPRFFKLPKAKGFNYKPLYYDPVKEEREKRRREIAKELGLKDTGGYVPTIQHGSMRSHSKRKFGVQRVSNIRMIIIIFILLFLAYLILFH